MAKMQAHDPRKTRIIKHIIHSNPFLKRQANAFNDLKTRLNRIFQTMSDQQINIFLNNPHASQMLFSEDFNPKNPISIMPFTRIMSNNLPKLPYYDRSKYITTNLHKGQQKLLLSEIEFLTQFGHIKHVLYIGSAPGFHIPCLAELFSHTIFYMYDPAFKNINHFDDLIKKKRVFIYPQYFTEETVQEFKKTHKITNSDQILLVSDIRRDMGDKTDFQHMNRVVMEDMDLQKKIVKLVNPHAAILKFRLPWLDHDIEYFDGIRYFGVYATTYSTETRLIVTDINSSKIYNGKVAEEELFYFNTIQRPAFYKHPEVNIDRIDHCYDCTAEIYIMQEYLKNAYKDYFNHKKMGPMLSQIFQQMHSKKPLDRAFKTKILNLQSTHNPHHLANSDEESVASVDVSSIIMFNTILMESLMD